MNCPGCCQPPHLCLCYQLRRLASQCPLNRAEAEATTEPALIEARQLLGDALAQELQDILCGRVPQPWVYTALREVHTMLQTRAPTSHALGAVSGALLADMIASGFGEGRRGTYERVAALLAIELLAAELTPPTAPRGPRLGDVALDLEGIRALSLLLARDMKEQMRRALERAAAKGEKS
jgi:hypothetical protein